MRACPGPSGPAAPHATLMESRIVQIATQNRSTDPKNSGAKTSTASVTQSWTDLNASAGNFRGRRPVIRDANGAFSASSPLGFDGRVDAGHGVRRVGHWPGRPVDNRQQPIVVYDLGV